MSQQILEMIAILNDAKKLLSKKDNDYAWSSWEDEKVALAEIDLLIAKLSSGISFDLVDVEVLFAPTGPLQEVSLSSGWESAFLKLADRMDRVVAEFKNK